MESDVFINSMVGILSQSIQIITLYTLYILQFYFLIKLKK